MAPWVEDTGLRGGQQGAGGRRGQGQLAPPQAEVVARTQAGSASQSSGLPSNSQEEVWQSCKH